MSINTILVEDHKVVRQGIKILLEIENDIKVIAEGDDGLEAVDLAKKYKDAVFVMDISLLKLNGLEAATQILRNDSSAKILILSACADDRNVARAVEMNISGYLSKNCSPNFLVDAIRKVHAGEKIYCPDIQKRIECLKITKRDPSQSQRPQLSIREVQVLQKIADGLTNNLTSQELNISIKTVEKHRQNLMRKLSIYNTAKLTRYALKEGLTIPIRTMK